MEIVRGEKKIKLTDEELTQANTEFVTRFMKAVIEENAPDYMSDQLMQSLAESSYDEYCKGDGKTEQECVEDVLETYLREHPMSCEKCAHYIKDKKRCTWSSDIEDIMADVSSVVDNPIDFAADCSGYIPVDEEPENVKSRN